MDHYQDAVDFLCRADKKLKRHIQKVGPCGLEISKTQTPFASLFNAIVYQQLTGKAADTILKRVLALYPNKRFPKPEDVLKTSEKKLRAAGLSASKVASIRDLAKKTIEGVVPTTAKIKKMSNQEIQEHLITIRGVGRWTIDMLLIFKLGRLDIVASTDYGVRKGFMKVYGLKELPTPEQIEEKAKCWQPYSSIVCWYMWRALD